MSNEVFADRVEAKKDQESTKQFTEGDKVQYDELLSSAGEFGRYQLLLLLSTCPFYMFGVFVYYSQIFITEASPNHWCWIPEMANMTDFDRRNLAIPKDDSIYGYSRCNAYVANWTEVLEKGLLPNESWKTTSCQHGWEFNSSEIPYPTIASDLSWVCDKGSYQTIAQSLFAVGSIIGGFLIGWISDRFGRIPAIVGSNLLGCIGGISSTFASNFIQFTICRFIMGMAYDNCMMMMYLLVLEYVAPRYRSFMANASFAVFYSLFVTVLPFIALNLGHWKLISLATSLPLALAIFTPLLVPESPRWLLSKGRIDDAVKKILTIGRINNTEVPPKLIEQFKWTMSKEPKHKENVTLIEVFKRPSLRTTLILVCLEFMCCNIILDGLVRTIGQLDFDFFLSFAVTSFTELPSMLLVAFILDIFGRRWLTVVVMLVSCLFSFLTVFVGSGIETVIFAAVARFAVNMSYSATMQWAAEVLPTEVRGSGVSLVHIFGYVGTVISPLIVYLNTVAYWLPLTIIGSVAALGALTAMFLPETANKEMPHTFEDAETLMKSQRFFEMPCLRRREDSTEEHANNDLEF